MTQEEILSGLKDIFKQVKPQLDTTNITREASLINDLGIDSLSLLLLSLAGVRLLVVRYWWQKK